MNNQGPVQFEDFGQNARVGQRYRKSKTKVPFQPSKLLIMSLLQ